MKKCPYCAEEIQDDAIVCRFCNHRIDGKKESGLSDRMIGFSALIIVIILGVVYTSTNDLWGMFVPRQQTSTATSTTVPMVNKRQDCVFGQSGYSYQVITQNVEGSGNCEFDDALVGSQLGFSTVTWDRKSDRICSYEIGDNTINVYEFRNVSKSPAQAICNWLKELPGYAIVSDWRIAQEIVSIESRGDFPALNPSSSISTINNTSTSCVLWSSITLADVGKTMCVYGTVRRTWFSEQQWTQYFTFSSDPQAIYFQKFSYVFDPGLDGRCVKFTGEILQSYSTPYMDLLPEDVIYLCD